MLTQSYLTGDWYESNDVDDFPQYTASWRKDYGWLEVTILGNADTIEDVRYIFSYDLAKDANYKTMDAVCEQIEGSMSPEEAADYIDTIVRIEGWN